MRHEPTILSVVGLGTQKLIIPRSGKLWVCGGGGVRNVLIVAMYVGRFGGQVDIERLSEYGNKV